jgi:energy-coupling factor transporter ATP-binding protein EcfA2
VRSDLPAVLDAVVTSYRAFLTDPDDTGSERTTAWIATRMTEAGHEVRGHDGALGLARDETDAVLGTLDRIVEAVIGGLAARGIVGTHAAALAIDGRAVVLAGRSGAGKSTLTLALLRAGAALLTDELTLIAGDDRTVLPYPRALHVSPTTVELLPELEFLHERPRQDLGGGSEWSVGVDDLKRAFGTVVAPATPLASIILLEARGAPADEPLIEPMSGAEAAIGLVRGTPAAARDFAGMLARVGGIAGSVPTYRLRATELARTAAAIRDHVAGTR